MMQVLSSSVVKQKLSKVVVLNIICVMLAIVCNAFEANGVLN